MHSLAMNGVFPSFFNRSAYNSACCGLLAVCTTAPDIETACSPSAMFSCAALPTDSVSVMSTSRLRFSPCMLCLAAAKAALSGLLFPTRSVLTESRYRCDVLKSPLLKKAKSSCFSLAIVDASAPSSAAR